jgi:hypothetical protein
MTPTLEQRAEEIAKKAVSDDYIEDGGYIRDWLYDDILAALRQTREEAYHQGFYEGTEKLPKNIYEKTFAEGRKYGLEEGPTTKQEILDFAVKFAKENYSKLTEKEAVRIRRVGWDDGFYAALEKAAEVADETGEKAIDPSQRICGRALAKAIRALASGSEK